MSAINAEAVTIPARNESRSGADAFINAYTSYLKFITVLPHVDTSHISYPPESGWPDFSETEKHLRRLGKSQAVIDLLRYIPQADEVIKIAGNSTIQVTWRDSNGISEQIGEMSDEDTREWFINASDHNPPSCNLNADQITVTYGGEEEINLVVNCVTGDVYPHSMNAQGGYFGEDMPDDFTELPPARPASVLFDEWRKQWLDLTWISVPKHHFQVLVEDFDTDDEVERAKALYKGCGWPNAFRRQECIDKLKDLKL